MEAGHLLEFFSLVLWLSCSVPFELRAGIQGLWAQEAELGAEDFWKVLLFSCPVHPSLLKSLGPEDNPWTPTPYALHALSS